MIEILETEIDREELKELMENISPWKCMYSPETLVDIYTRSGPDSTRLETALGEDWLADAHSSESQSHAAVYDFEDMAEIDFEEDSYMPRRRL